MKAYIDLEKSAEVDVEGFVFTSIPGISGTEHSVTNAKFYVHPAIFQAESIVAETLKAKSRVAAMVYLDEDPLDPFERFKFRIIKAKDVDENSEDIVEVLATLLSSERGDHAENHIGILIVVSDIPDDIEDDQLIDRLARYPLKDSIPRAAIAAVKACDVHMATGF